MGFHFRIFRAQGELLVAACDEDVYGRTFEDGRLVLTVDRKFYGKEIAEWEHLHPLFAEATLLNLVGEELVARAVEEGFIDAESVLKVKGVPHAQMVRV